ncbi:MAG: hypothetical protein WC358_02785 [Ignavibacteria bacterium]
MKRSSKIILLICIMLLGLLFFSCSKKEEQKKDTDKNIDSVGDVYDSIITNKTSKVTSADVKKKFNEIKKKYENELDAIGNTEVKFSDLTGNGNEEAILYYVLVARGGNVITGSGLIIYTINNDKLEFLRDYNLDGAVIKSIKDGMIFCIKYDYAPGDPGCCPSKKKPFKLKYENNNISFIP